MHVPALGTCPHRPHASDFLESYFLEEEMGATRPSSTGWAGTSVTASLLGLGGSSLTTLEPSLPNCGTSETKAFVGKEHKETSSQYLKKNQLYKETNLSLRIG